MHGTDPYWKEAAEFIKTVAKTKHLRTGKTISIIYNYR